MGSRPPESLPHLWISTGHDWRRTDSPNQEMRVDPNFWRQLDRLREICVIQLCVVVQGGAIEATLIFRCFMMFG